MCSARIVQCQLPDSSCPCAIANSSVTTAHAAAAVTSLRETRARAATTVSTPNAATATRPRKPCTPCTVIDATLAGQIKNPAIIASELEITSVNHDAVADLMVVLLSPKLAVPVQQAGCRGNPASAHRTAPGMRAAMPESATIADF